MAENVRRIRRRNSILHTAILLLSVLVILLGIAGLTGLDRSRLSLAVLFFPLGIAEILEGVFRYRQQPRGRKRPAGLIGSCLAACVLFLIGAAAAVFLRSV